MSRILDVNNYLFISPKKIGISVNESKDFSEIYKKEIHISEKTNQINFGLINAFLENNIFFHIISYVLEIFFHSQFIN